MRRIELKKIANFFTGVRASLQKKTLLLLLVISVVPLVGLSINNIQQTRRALAEAAEIRLKAGAAQTAIALDAFMKATTDSIRVEASITPFVLYMQETADKRSGSEHEKNAVIMLNNLSRKDPVFILSYAILDLQGNILLDTQINNIGNSEGKEEYFTNTIKSQFPQISPVLQDANGQRAIRFSSPIRNKNSTVVGVLRAEYTATIFQKIVIESSASAGESTNALLLDEYNIQLVNNMDAGQVQKTIAPIPAKEYELAIKEKRLIAADQISDKVEFYNAIKSDPQKTFLTVDMFPEITGSDAVALAKMESMPWLVVFTQPEDVFLNEVKTQTRVNMLLVTAISLLVVAASVYASRSLTYPITRLTKVTNQFARGNLKARAQINREDELGTLASAFNDTADILQKLIAELESKNTELERFTYTVSHDLKSPLITIRGFLGYIKDDAEKGDLQRLNKDMERILVATDKMQLMIADLLELSRIGKLINAPKDVPFKTIVEEAIALTAGQINEHHVEIVVSDNLPVLFGDHARLVEVVQNLIDNAIKFSKDLPHPRLEIGAKGLDKEGNAILFVRDNGIGIDEKFHQRIFDLFNKLDTNTEGTGIGLAFIKRIIEVHGGTIWVESQGQGKGATFYFTVPIPK